MLRRFPALCAALIGPCLIAADPAARAQPMPVWDAGLLPGDTAVAAAVNSQQDQSIARGGERFLVVWSDYRARSGGGQTIQSDGDILGIRLDAQGGPIDAVPFVIAGGMGLQRYPTAAWNGESWLVLYQSQDPSGGYFATNIRAVRVSPEGVVLDPQPIMLPPTQFEPGTIGLNVAGLGGQWLVTRCVYHGDGYGTFLAGQRIGGDGILLDPTPNMLIDWVYGSTRVLASGGEYLVAGPDWNSSSTFKARRVGLDAQPVGQPYSVPGLTLAGDGTEYYVTWISGYTTIVGSRMTADGTLLDPGGTPLFSDPAVGYYHTNLAHDGSNWWFEWGAADDLRTLRISPGGAVLDPGGVPLPITIGGTVNQAYGVQMAPAPGGGVHVAWYDVRPALGYDANVFVLPVGAANVPGSEGCVSTGTPSQRNPDFAPGPGGTAAIVFVSEAANDDRVLVHLLDAAGQPATLEPIEVHRGPTVGKAGIAWNGALFMVAWDEGAAGLSPTQIRARRMAPDGSFIDAAPFDVMPGFNADIEALGEDFLVVGARVAPYPEFIDLFGSRIHGPTAALLDGPTGVLLHAGYVSAMPRARTDGTQWLVAAHSMWSHDSPQGDAILSRVPAAGPPQPAFNPTPFAGGSGDLDVAFSGSSYLLVWRMNSLANANNFIAGRIMNADGTLAPGWFTIAEAPGRQLRPTVDWDGTSFVVAWDDQRQQEAFFDARTDVYAARVSSDGVVLDPTGIAVHVAPGGVAAAAIHSRPDGVSYVAAARFTPEPALDSYRIGVSILGEQSVPGDVTGDGVVDVSDLVGVVLAWGPCPPPPAGCPADVTGDGAVDVNDLVAVILSWSD